MACLSKTISMRVFCRSGCKKCVHMPNLLEPTTWCAFIFFLLFVYLKLFHLFVCLLFIYVFIFFSLTRSHTHCRNSSRQKRNWFHHLLTLMFSKPVWPIFSGFFNDNLVHASPYNESNVWKTHSHVIFQVFWHPTTVWWKDRNLISPQKSLLKILTSAMCFFCEVVFFLCQDFPMNQFNFIKLVWMSHSWIRLICFSDSFNFIPDWCLV